MSEKKYSATDSNVKKAFYMLRTQGPWKAAKKVASYLKLHKNVDYMTWYRKHMPNQEDLRTEIERSKEFSYRPLVSILVPLYRTSSDFLTALIDSLQKQTYENWELCLADGSGDHAAGQKIKNVVLSYEKDNRIHYQDLNENRGIAGNTNAALAMASGEWVVLCDHDDFLAENALYECVKLLNQAENPERSDISMIYTDEDKTDKEGKQFYYPHMKPDFNLDLLRSINYICHMLMVRRELADSVGGFRDDYDGAQDYDFILRCLEEVLKKNPKLGMAGLSAAVKHVAMPLYHWRIHEVSTAGDLDSKDYAHKAGLLALNDHYRRSGIKAEAVSGETGAFYKTVYHISEEPMISILIPNKDHVEELKGCLESIAMQDYGNYEILIIENNSTDKKTFAYYRSLKQDPHVRLLRWKAEFDYAAVNNYGAERAKGTYLLFLNNDTRMLDKDCLRQLLSFCQREEIGAVGARLYYPNGALQHAGVFVGYEGRAGHLFSTMKEEDGVYFDRSRMAQDFSAVTAACMMVSAELFRRLRGFDPHLKIALNDIDLCLRIREAGYLVAYDPEAKLCHNESMSRSLDILPKEQERFEQEVKFFQDRWFKILKNGDPYYNRNLTLKKADCSLRED